MVKHFVSLGADIYARDDEALRWASEYGRLDVIKYLCSLGANVNALGDDRVIKYAKTEEIRYFLLNHINEKVRK